MLVMVLPNRLGSRGSLGVLAKGALMALGLPPAGILLMLMLLLLMLPFGGLLG